MLIKTILLTFLWLIWTYKKKQFKKHLGKDPLNKILQTQIKQSKELKIVNVEKGAD